MSPEHIKQFLIVYDIDAQLAKVTEFPPEREQEALDAYAECEERFRNDQNIEIVLIGSDSLETVKRTHSSYFPSEDEGSILATA